MTRRVYTHAYASVRFMGPTLDPIEVTKALHMPPDRQCRDGEPTLVRTKKGKVLEYAPCSTGLWLMSSEKWVDSPRLETHLDWLLQQLEPHAEAIQRLMAGDVTGDFFCFSSGSTDEPPSYPRAIAERAAALCLAIEIDHYC